MTFMNPNTLITPAEVIDLAFADAGYLPPDSIGAADIAAAETRTLLPVTGQSLWQSLLEGKYPALRRDYVLPAAAAAVRLGMQPMLDLRCGAGGAALCALPGERAADEQTLLRSRKAQRSRLAALLRRLSDHLDACADRYPEYDARDNVLHRVSVCGGLLLLR
ncbi:MAG: hypothetical protein K2H69_03775 [Alistipes sp.]|nr:hypothetical protein [Alistipes sp.]